MSTVGYGRFLVHFFFFFFFIFFVLFFVFNHCVDQLDILSLSFVIANHSVLQLLSTVLNNDNLQVTLCRKLVGERFWPVLHH